MTERVASRELDAEIAEKVMGWQRFPYMVTYEAPNIASIAYCPPGIPVHVGTVEKVPGYSTEIAAAWLVVEKMRESEPLFFELHGTGSITHKDAVLKPYGRFAARFVSDLRPTPFSVAGTAPLAICRAAVAAIEGKGAHSAGVD